MEDDLYTKRGLLLQRIDNLIYSRSGRYLGQVENQRVFDPNGRYCGTIVGDRVVYRTTDSAAVSTESAAAPHTASAHASNKGSSVWGIEPPFADA
jgi:hypothetical protein